MQPFNGSDAQKRKAPTNKAKGGKSVGSPRLAGKNAKSASMKQTAKPKKTKSTPVVGKMDINGFRRYAGRPKKGM